MKVIIIILVVILGLSSVSYSQEKEIIAQGDTLFEHGNMKGAIEEYKKAYTINPFNSETVYSLASAFSLARQTDSALRYLNEFILLDTVVYPLVNPDFVKTRENKDWQIFEDKLVEELVIKYNNPYKDIEYAKKLWKMQALDQAYYREIMLIRNKISPDCYAAYSIWELKEKLNNQNVKELEELIGEKGWPKKSVVGETASNSAFLIIQHSTYELQKKYLPILKQLCEENEAKWEGYALMYDRVQVGENKPQRYGSQIRYNDSTKSYELFPLEDETKVNEWRKEVKLGNLEGYVSQWGIVFKPKKNN